MNLTSIKFVPSCHGRDPYICNEKDHNMSTSLGTDSNEYFKVSILFFIFSWLIESKVYYVQSSVKVISLYNQKNIIMNYEINTNYCNFFKQK